LSEAVSAEGAATVAADWILSERRWFSAASLRLTSRSDSTVRWTSASAA
jgi:hypothetical protein